jgi:hypothetical protein
MLFMLGTSGFTSIMWRFSELFSSRWRASTAALEDEDAFSASNTFKVVFSWVSPSVLTSSLLLLAAMVRVNDVVDQEFVNEVGDKLTMRISR